MMWNTTMCGGSWVVRLVCSLDCDLRFYTSTSRLTNAIMNGISRERPRTGRPESLQCPKMGGRYSTKFEVCGESFYGHIQVAAVIYQASVCHGPMVQLDDTIPTLRRRLKNTWLEATHVTGPFCCRHRRILVSLYNGP